ncbi:hypothetical protein 7S11_2 [uncultured Caudovirales phage]|uniref:Uncharacterized protein n=1 Tax=uncultured Caudovirales phage TaxID=2100421 RepID=A0A2I2MUH5_9CAUD|nr:hypothetical protein 7S11_2 [uncultured Caudovirales phage]
MKQLRVTHADGEEVFPGESSFGIDEGILLVFADRTQNVIIKAYNRELWAFAEYEDAP